MKIHCLPLCTVLDLCTQLTFYIQFLCTISLHTVLMMTQFSDWKVQPIWTEL